MSEEEKKAIKELKHYINMIPYWRKQEEYTNIEIDNYIKKVLNLIDKQQKEIEEKNVAINKMSKDISRQLKEIEKLNFENHMLKKWNKQLDKNCISRDKIREKIKEIESYAFTSKEEKNQQDYAIERIRELLEEK